MIAFTGVILAGGQGNRMLGQDKGLLFLNGKPLYQCVLQRFRSQVNIVLISANRNIDLYQSSGYKVISDSILNYPGPLAGMLSGLRYSRTEWVAFCACDMPWIPENFVARLWQKREGAPAVWVKSSQHDHPTLALVNRGLVDVLETWVLKGKRKLIAFLLEQGGHALPFNDPESAFLNINTPEDLIQAEVISLPSENG